MTVPPTSGHAVSLQLNLSINSLPDTLQAQLLGESKLTVRNEPLVAFPLDSSSCGENTLWEYRGARESITNYVAGTRKRKVNAA